MLIALKIPPFLLAVYLTWVFLAKAPPPIDVFAEMEAEEKAEEERGGARGSTGRPTVTGHAAETAEEAAARGRGGPSPA